MNKHEQNFLYLLRSAIVNQNAGTLAVASGIARRDPDLLFRAVRSLVIENKERLSFMQKALATLRKGRAEWAKAYVFLESELRLYSQKNFTGAWDDPVEAGMTAEFTKAYVKEKEEVDKIYNVGF